MARLNWVRLANVKTRDSIFSLSICIFVCLRCCRRFALDFPLQSQKNLFFIALSCDATTVLYFQALNVTYRWLLFPCVDMFGIRHNNTSEIDICISPRLLVNRCRNVFHNITYRMNRVILVQPSYCNVVLSYQENLSDCQVRKMMASLRSTPTG